MSDGAPINPSMLRWARERSGYSIQDVADRLRIKPETVTNWELGEAEITYGRVDALAAFYRRRSAVFYLTEPPEEDETLPPDFRAEQETRTPGILLLVRRAKERRDIALELAAELNEPPMRFTFEATPHEDTEDVGARLRAFLRLEEPTETWENDTHGYEALGARKFAAETAGALVFQAPAEEIGHASGLSIYFDTCPVAVLRGSDNAKRRSFTLMHELAHLGLRSGGVCDLHDDGIELFCNRVAAATLVSADALRREIRRRGAASSPPSKDVAHLAKVFSVSEQAMMLRLVTIGAISLDAYMARRAEFSMRTGSAQSGGSHHQVVLSRNGERFSRIVLDAYDRGLITSHRASTTLGTNVASLEKIAEGLAKKSFRRAS
ncbi:MAG: ImmA/IrrE family metallo-endopeptidase [Byssovorax sp.]